MKPSVNSPGNRPRITVQPPVAPPKIVPPPAPDIVENVDRFLLLQGKTEVELLLKGLEATGERNAVADSLKKRLSVAQRYFKTLEASSILKAAARKRDTQRRRDGK